MSKKCSRYEIDGYEVVFVPWHCAYMDEDFIAVYIMKDGREVMRAGMTHAEPNEHAAQKGIELYKALSELRGDAE